MTILMELTFVAFPSLAAAAMQFWKACFMLLRKLSDDVLKQMFAAASDIVTSLIDGRCLPLVWVTLF